MLFTTANYCRALMSSFSILGCSRHDLNRYHHRSLIREYEISKSIHQSAISCTKYPQRRQFIQFLSTFATLLLSVSPPADASTKTNQKRFNFFSLSDMDSKKRKVKNGDDMTPVNVPEVKQQDTLDGFLLGKGLDIESWMLKLLPIKNNVFQTLQQDISSISILRGPFIILVKIFMIATDRRIIFIRYSFSFCSMCIYYIL